jgi:hypothetical protein
MSDPKREYSGWPVPEQTKTEPEKKKPGRKPAAEIEAEAK